MRTRSASRRTPRSSGSVATVRAQPDYGPGRPTTEDRLRAVHQARLEVAAQAYQQQLDHAQQARAAEQQATCQACGQVDHHTTGSRTIHGMDCRVCDRCAPVIDRQISDRLAKDDVDGTSRGDRVAAWLDRVAASGAQPDSAGAARRMLEQMAALSGRTRR